MKTYDIEKLKDSYNRMAAGEFASASAQFCQELAKVPQSHYNNIFFPGEAENKLVIVMDFILQEGKLYYNIKPYDNEQGKKTVTFDQFPPLSTEAARNIIAAIEVAEINHKEEKKRRKQFNRIREQLERAKERENNK